MNEYQDINKTLRNETADQLEKIAQRLRSGSRPWLTSIAIDDINAPINGDRHFKRSVKGIDYNGEPFSISFDPEYNKVVGKNE